MDIKLLMLFALSAVSVASRSQWKLAGQDNKIYSGDIKFQMALSQSWECAKACNNYGAFCLAFGFVPSKGICYGYGNTTNPEYVTGAQLWSRICSLPGYHVEPALDKCIKFSTNMLGWTNASMACEADGASLLRLDKQEPVLGWRLYDSGWNRFWIGGRDVGVDNDTDWKWENGVTVNDSQWRPGYSSTGKCIYINKFHEGLSTYNCKSKKVSICEE